MNNMNDIYERKYIELLNWLKKEKKFYEWFDDRTVLLQEIIRKAEEIYNKETIKPTVG